MDFTITQYTQLLKTLQSRGFLFYTFSDYLLSFPKPQTPNTEQGTKNTEQGTPNTEQGTKNTEQGTKNTEQGTQNTEQGTKNTEQGTKNKEQRTRNKIIILRHDVEDRYENALRMAVIQHAMGIKGSYYFRFLPKSYSKDIIKKIANLGHEIGYHYDDLSVCKGNRVVALQRFEHHLIELRAIAPVQTMTMEGAPLSKYDNRNLWKPEHQTTNNEQKTKNTEQRTKNTEQRTTNNEQKTKNTEQKTPNTEHQTKNKEQRTPNKEHRTPNTEQRTPNTEQPYNKYGIIAEPYFDIDFNKMFYLTDTGRRWDGWKTSVRDKVPQQTEWVKQGLVFHSTQDIIKAVEEGRLPEKIMMTFHPQRWNNKAFPWLKELLIQNLKNQIKKLLIKRNK